MPVFKIHTARFPSWSEIDFVKHIWLPANSSRIFTCSSPAGKLFIIEGSGFVKNKKGKKSISASQWIDMKGSDAAFEIVSDKDPLVLLWIGGRWGKKTGGCGFFTLQNSKSPYNSGDPVVYHRTTEFDNHYHDCDEYWFILKGQGRVVSEGKFYEVGPGDCVATRCGDHHDFPEVYQPVSGIYFETSLRGKKRMGHLWDHIHGPAKSVS